MSEITRYASFIVQTMYNISEAHVENEIYKNRASSEVDEFSIRDLFGLISSYKHFFSVVYVILFLALGVFFIGVRGMRTEVSFKVIDLPKETEIFVTFLREVLNAESIRNSIGDVKRFAHDKKDESIEIATSYLGFGDESSSRTLVETEIIAEVRRREIGLVSDSIKWLYWLKRQNYAAQLAQLGADRESYSAKLMSLKQFLGSSTDYTENLSIQTNSLNRGEFGYLGQINLLPVKAQVTFFTIALSEVDVLTNDLINKIKMLDLLRGGSPLAGELQELFEKNKGILFFDSTKQTRIVEVEVVRPQFAKLLRNSLFTAIAAFFLAVCGTLGWHFYQSKKSGSQT